jgi:uncharacterized protein (DUF2062 family)
MEFIDFTLEFSWSWIITQGKLIWLPLLTGSLITGLVFGGLGYIFINLLWKWKVQKNWMARQGKREDCD